MLNAHVTPELATETISLAMGKTPVLAYWATVPSIGNSLAVIKDREDPTTMAHTAKICTQKWIPGKWKHRLKPAVPWWLTQCNQPCILDLSPSPKRDRCLSISPPSGNLVTSRNRGIQCWGLPRQDPVLAAKLPASHSKHFLLAFCS